MTSRKRIRSSTPGSVTGGDVIIVGGGQGVGLDMGFQTENMDIGFEQTRDLGTETEEMGFSMTPTIATGSESHDDDISLTGSATYPQGTESAAMGFGMEQTRSTGTESQGTFTASAVAEISQHTTTATAVTADAPAWGSVASAQGPANGTLATVVSPTGLDTSQDATLRCSGLVVPSSPSGFTRTAVGIRIIHKWDLTITGAIAGVTDVTATITLRDSADASIATLSTRLASGGAGTQATLLTEDFDITSLVSDAQLAAGVKIDCRIFTTGVFTSTVNGNFSWDVDIVHLTASYNRSGIT